MLYLKSWLEDYIDLSGVSLADMNKQISIKVAELDEVIDINDWFDGKVVLGKIASMRKHPDADKLQICDVNIGSETVVILTAAPNAYEGMYVPVALDGAKLPHVTIESRPMRGIMSQGMCLGKSELLLEAEESPGLWDIKEEVNIADDVVGHSICSVLPELFPSDTIFDIDILPDKFAYLSSHLSLALELGYIFGTHRFKGLAASMYAGDIRGEIEQYLKSIPKKEVDFEDKTGYAKVFTTWSISQNSAILSPHQWSQRLFLTQENLTFSPADISNYILLDIGQPTHFFGGDTNPNGWSIEAAKGGEVFKGLGQLKSAVLPEGTPVIKAQDTMMALPAISGGAETKSSTGDTSLIIECAVFEPEKVVEHSFKLGYRSLASKYYAAGVSESLIPLAIYRLKDMPWEWVSNICYGAENVEAVLEPKQSVLVDWEYVINRLDNSLSKEVITDALSFFGSVDGDRFTPRSFYNVISNSEDIIQEVSRVLGYAFANDELLVSLGHPELSNGESHTLLLEKSIKYGFNEVITRPFIETEFSNEEILIDAHWHNLKLLSTYRADRPLIRTHVVVHHLQSISKSLLKGMSAPAVCELTRVYHKDERNDSNFEERIVYGCAWEGRGYKATSYLKDIGLSLGGDSIFLRETESVLGRQFEYELPQGVSARIWEIKNSIKKKFGIPLSKSIWGMELTIPDVFLRINTMPTLKRASEYPDITRSYSLQGGMSWKEVEDIIQELPCPFAHILVKPIEHSPEYRTYTFSLTYTPSSRTLKKDEIQKWETDLLAKFQVADSSAQWR